MSKTKARKRPTPQRSMIQGTKQNSTLPTTRRNPGRGSAVASRMEAAQGVLMPAFVALGCWGLAISFLFFFPDPNHVLYAGMAAAMGLIWSIMVGSRIARIMRMSRAGRIYK